MQIFYYGIWLAGAAGLISLIATAISNRQTLKDISKMPSSKGKWLQSFCRDLDQAEREHADVKNPVVFVTRRVNGRKIGPISQYRMKGMMWYAFVLSFLFMGIAYYQVSEAGSRTLADLFAHSDLVAAGLGVPLALVLLKQFLGISYQETCIRDALLDYMENRSASSAKDKLHAAAAPAEAPVKMPVQAKPARLPKRDRNVKAADREKDKDAVQEKILEQISLGIQETAASKDKYEHLLSKEEEQIIRDVINEFLA